MYTRLSKKESALTLQADHKQRWIDRATKGLWIRHKFGGVIGAGREKALTFVGLTGTTGVEIALRFDLRLHAPLAFDPPIGHRAYHPWAC